MELDNWDGFYEANQYPFEKGTSNDAIQVAGYKNTGEVLDIGCGEGDNAMFFASKGFRVTAVDISKVIISRLVRESQEGCLDIKTVVSSVRNYKFDQDYDIIFARNLLHYLLRDNGLKLIRNIQEHTRGGGINLIRANMRSPHLFNEENKDNCFLDTNELLNLYLNESWNVLNYNEQKTQPMASHNGQTQMQAVIIAQRLEDKV